MSELTNDDKALLQPYADLLADLLEKIEMLDGEDLAALTKACDGPTSTNCWWATKYAADFLKPVLAREYGRRTMAEIKRGDAVFRNMIGS
jgi:hypothetical protein